GVSNPTGVFFYNQTVTDIISAVETFEQKIDSFLPVKCRDNTLRFSSERFQLEIKKYIDSKWLIFNESKKIIY
ncbi:glycosyltransferase family 4 protein, partial [Klebsiella pneumoniae]|nr:glycosyltransferase family 4 protein [Klebsiella pneumoniae]